MAAPRHQPSRSSPTTGVSLPHGPSGRLLFRHGSSRNRRPRCSNLCTTNCLPGTRRTRERRPSSKSRTSWSADMLYAVVLTIHSWLRWGVLLAGLAAFVRSAIGASRRASWTPADDRAGFWFSMVLDLQFLLGLVLYIFLSPFTHAAFRDIGEAMRNSGLRFWAVEHAFGMIIGVALVHVGRVRARK